MKTRLLLGIALLSHASLLSANIYVPNASLIGESVYINAHQEYADITGVFEFDGIGTKNRILYVPIFSAKDADTVETLAAAEVEISAFGGVLQDLLPCDPPIVVVSNPGAPIVHWYKLDFDSAMDTWLETKGAVTLDDVRLIVKMTYKQRRIDDIINYLPIIMGDSRRARWSYQLFARSPIKPLTVISENEHVETLGEIRIFYLRNSEIIKLK